MKRIVIPAIGLLLLAGAAFAVLGSDNESADANRLLFGETTQTTEPQSEAHTLTDEGPAQTDEDSHQPERREVVEDPLIAQNKSLKHDLTAATAENQRLARTVKKLQRELNTLRAERTVEQYLTFLGTKPEEKEKARARLQRRLDGSEVMPTMADFHTAMTATSPSTIRRVLELESAFQKELARHEHTKDELPTWKAKMAYQRSTIDTWSKMRIGQLRAELHAYGVPNPHIQRFVGAYVDSGD